MLTTLFIEPNLETPVSECVGMVAGLSSLTPEEQCPYYTPPRLLPHST